MTKTDNFLMTPPIDYEMYAKNLIDKAMEKSAQGSHRQLNCDQAYSGNSSAEAGRTPKFISKLHKDPDNRAPARSDYRSIKRIFSATRAVNCIVNDQ